MQGPATVVEGVLKLYDKGKIDFCETMPEAIMGEIDRALTDNPRLSHAEKRASVPGYQPKKPI